MVINNLLKFASCMAIACSAFAGSGGGWVSSGGEIFKNAKNPWFVKNTTDVKYCVEFSQDEFSIAKQDAIKLIDEALKFWNSETDGESALEIKSPIGPQSPDVVQVATQNFIFQTTCPADAELIFKFGYKTLDPNEIVKLVDPTKYLGVTIRKEYQEDTLKGSGIIYISGDKGGHAYASGSTDNISEAWRYPKLLQYAIMHELGHVFGLPHSGSGMMSEVFLDQLLIKRVAALYVREPILPVIKAISTAEICADPVIPKGSQSFVAEYFSLSFKEDCLRIQVNSNKREFSILTRKNGTQDPWKQIGTLFVDKNELTDFSLKPALLLQITDQQKVFKVNMVQYLIGPVYQSYKVDGHINFGTSMKPYPVQIDMSPDSLVIYGTHNNKIRQIFSFGSPFLYNLINPF